MNKINNYIVSLVFIFLCLKVKAEFNYSALTVFIQNQKDTPEVTYEKALILFKEGEYSRSLKRVLPLTELNLENPILSAKVNLLVGKILIERTRNVKVFEENLLIGKNSRKESVTYIRKSLSFLKYVNFETINKHSKDLLTTEVYFSLSSAFSELSSLDSAKYYYKKLMDIDNVSNDIYDIKAKAYSNLGGIYINQDSLDLAKFYTNKAIEIHKILDNKLALSGEFSNLASIYVSKKKYKKAKELYLKGLTYIKDEKDLESLENIELLKDNIAWTLYHLKDPEAYIYVTESHSIRDSLKQDATAKQIEEIKAENDVAKVQRAEKDKRDALEQKTWIIGGIGVAVSLLLLFIANLFKLRQRSLSLQLSQNELQQQRKLERLKSQTQVKILNATIDGKETERKEIAEILHDNVSALLSSASLHLQASQKQYDGSAPIELEKTRQIIAEASQKIRDLSHNLISSVLLKFGLEYAVKDLAKKFSNSSIKIYTVVDNLHRYSEAYELKIFNIIQELLNNVLKHSNASNAYIMMEEEDGKLNIIVKDDGDGFETKNKLETQKGIGLNHIKARIHIMKGYFVIESEIGKGTKATMNIPIVEKTKMVIA